MVIDPVSLSAEHQAEAWLEDLLGEAGRGGGEALDDRQPRRVPAPPGGGRPPRARADADPGHRRPRRLGRGRAARRRSLDVTRASCRCRQPARRRLFGRRSRRERNEELVHLEHFAALLGVAPAAARCARSWPCAHAPTSTPGASRTRRCELRQALTDGRRGAARRRRRQDLVLRVDELRAAVRRRRAGGRARPRGGAGGPADEEGPRPDGELLAHALGRLEAALRARQQRV